MEDVESQGVDVAKGNFVFFARKMRYEVVLHKRDPKSRFLAKDGKKNGKSILLYIHTLNSY